ncbi:MAG: Na+:solute symporter [Leptospiraceae bacterium]|nr:Na+:solute symporter [Leptospiraceae bacterium]
MGFIDIIIFCIYALLLLAILFYLRNRNKAMADFFLGGRKLPWYLAALSMVATTFGADTPLLVAGIVAKDGISGNWLWWNFAFSGMATAIFFGHLWRRSGVTTDAEFADIRYEGKPAEYLRKFRAFYLALPVNLIILGWVNLGMMKFIEMALDWPVWPVIIVLNLVLILQTMAAGLWGVVITDAVQFFLGMLGSILIAVFAVNKTGGLANLVAEVAKLDNGLEILRFSPFSAEGLTLTLGVYLFMQWWASWYPGAEPGGGGYIVQRVLSARSEKDARKSLIAFNFAHYILRPWPWILAGLAALVLFPELEDKEAGFPLIVKEMAGTGLTGLLSVAFFSAYMSTVSTHLNWGASYLMLDIYRPWQKKRWERNQSPGPGNSMNTSSGNKNSPETEQQNKIEMRLSRFATLGLAIGALGVTLIFDTIKDAWQILLMLGAGTGPVYLLRWYWWRINAWSEISALFFAFLSSLILLLFNFESFAYTMIITTIVTSVAWLTVTFVTPEVSLNHLQKFYDRTRPEGPGWSKFSDGQNQFPFRLFLQWFALCVILYSSLFAGWWLFIGRFIPV